MAPGVIYVPNKNIEFVDMSLKCTEERKEAEERLKNTWQNYCEAGDELDANTQLNKRAARLSSIEDETMLPLPDDVLTRNLGLDIVVVVTKVIKCLPFVVSYRTLIDFFLSLN